MWRDRLATAFILAVILLAGLALRSINLTNWDERKGLHPDERFVATTVSNLQLPHSIGAYFNSAISPLNPRNFEWSRMFVYGTLPTTLTRVAMAFVSRPEWNDPTIVGRALSAFFDLVACLALYFLGRRVFGRSVGLLAAALYAFTVMPIQQSHFFTTDNFGVAWTTLALVAAVRLGAAGRWRDAIWAGVFTGAAVASKINLAALGLIVGLAALQSQVPRSPSEEPWADRVRPSPLSLWLKAGLLLTVAGAATLLSFRILQPDAFTGPSFWNIRLEPRFLSNLRDIRGQVNGTVDMPPSHQWASRTPYLFALQNMVVWGMGLPLGLAAWLGFAAAGVNLFRTRRGVLGLVRSPCFIPWAWIALYFAWQGGGFNPSLRYFLPIYPPLILFAAWGSLAFGKWLFSHWSRLPIAAFAPRRLLLRGLLPAALVLLSTASWAWAFTRIYTRPHTRIAAAQWMKSNAPQGSAMTWEVWDDPLPDTNGNDTACIPFCQIDTAPYAEDEPSKFLGSMQSTKDPNDAPTNEEWVDGLLGQLKRADYVVLSSGRVYTSVARLPHRFPATLRYYRALFDGSLGFDLVADIHSFPSLFGLPIPDLSAEEQFTVYDHPRVLIFRRTARFTPENARDIIMGGLNWDEIYRISALTTSSVPTALRLPENKWRLLQGADSRYLFDGSALANASEAGAVQWATALAAWLAGVELLGLAALGFIWRYRLPLPDRGLLSARLIGLLLWALPPALLAASGVAGVSHVALGVWYGLLAGFGVRLLILERAAIRDFLRRRRMEVWGLQALYFGAIALGLLLRSLSGWSIPGATSFGPAQWAALLRSPVLPPPDPLFAGGQLVTPYAAVLPVAMLGRLLGVAPALSYNLALATLLALLVTLVAAAARVWGRRAAVPFLAALLVLAPGLLVGPFGSDIRALTPLGALISGNLGALAAAVMAVGALVLGRAWAQRAAGVSLARRGFAQNLLLFGPAAAGLALLRAADRWAFVAVALPMAASVWLGFVGGTPRRPARGFLAVFGLVAAALALAWPFTVVGPAIGSAPIALLAAPALALGLAAVLLLLTTYSAIVTLRVADRTIAVALASGLAGWLGLGFALGWSLPLLLAPLAILLLWLAVEMLLPGRNHGRSAALLFAALSGLTLLGVADRVVVGRMLGDAQLIFVVGLTLLCCATAWALPRLALLARPRGVGVSVLVAALLLGSLALGLGETVRFGAARQPVPGLVTTPALQGALDALAADARGVPVVALAPAANVPVAVGATGAQALLAAPEAENLLRAILRPSLDLVVGGRARALSEIFGPDPARAATQLQDYAVDYVLVGPDERAAFGPSAGSALPQLAASGALRQVYTSGDVTLYRATAPHPDPSYVARPANLPLPSLKTGMLDRPLAELPDTGMYAWNRWVAGSGALAILVWLVLFEALGVLAWPLAARVFPNASDRGWSWSKLIGLLVWGYAIWLPVSLGWWSYGWWSLVAGALVLLALSWLASGRFRSAQRRRAARLPGERHAFWTDVLRSEALFLGAFAVWTLVRAANPDLWQPWFGGEKPFEFGMLNAIVRSPVMPPPDPFFSGGAINYYYYGLFLVSVPIRATGIDPAIAFNLIIPVLFALTVVGAAAVVRELTGRWRWGLFGILTVALLGPVASVFAIGESRGLIAALQALAPGFAGWGARLGTWFWGPSRVIPYTINEFPFFSFLFADLHPHMIMLPVTILAVALAIELGRTTYRRLSGAALGLAALALGTLAAANSWDAPTYGMVIGGALIGRAWRGSLWRPHRARAVTFAAGLAVALLAAGLLLFLPFFTQYQAMVGGIGRVRYPDSLRQFAAIYGSSLFVSLTLLGGLGWFAGRRVSRPFFGRAVRGGAIALPLLSVALLLVASTFARAPVAQDAPRVPNPPILAAILAALVVFALLLALIARLRDEDWLVLWIITAALLVALGIQFVFVRDHLSGSDWERMNTVFKFGLQIWTLLALAAAAGVPLVLRMLRRAGDGITGVWLGMLTVLLLAGAAYPVVATPSRVAQRFPDTPGLTLDGLAFMDTGRYEHDGKQIDLRGDAYAIRWLKQNLRGMPVVLQSGAEFYRAYGVRIAANTGFPTVIGELHENEQRPGSSVEARVNDVREIWNTPDPRRALDLLHKYAVDYVYIGEAERKFYDPAGLNKWDAMAGKSLDVVYDTAGVRIYHVRPRPPAATAVRLAEPDVTASPDAPLPLGASADDPALKRLEAEQQARPQDSATAFRLASSYLQAGRLSDAARVLEPAALANPKDVPLHQFLGDVEAQLGRADQAVAAWQAAADADPSAGNIAKLGTGLVQLGRFDEAERTLKRARQADPNEPLIHYYLADLAQKRNGPNDAATALREYQAYLEQAPADSPYRPQAEQALEQLGR
jgi:YYY domain-containing protein